MVRARVSFSTGSFIPDGLAPSALGLPVVIPSGLGSSDDGPAINTAFGSLPTNGGYVQLPTGTLSVATTILNQHAGAILRGAGCSHSPYTGASGGTILNWTGAVGGTIIQVETPSNAASELKGQGVEDMMIGAAGNTHGRSLMIVSVYGGRFRNLHCRQPTICGIDISTYDLGGGVVSDTQHCLFEHITINTQNGTTGIGLRCDSLQSGNAGNTSLNTFARLLVYHKNGVGIQLSDCDGLTFAGVIVNRAGGGTGNGVVFAASNTGGKYYARNNQFFNLESLAPIVAQGTASGTQVSGPNLVTLSSGNSTPNPTVEAGAKLTWYRDEGSFAGNPIYSGALPTTAAFSSGVGQQISTARNVTLMVPVTFNPSGAATATCAVALSPDNTTYTNVGTPTEPVGLTFDGTVHLLTIPVPAGWYVKLTVVNATIGTGTYY